MYTAGLMVDAQIRKREFLDRLSRVGISITYDSVFSLSTQLRETVMQQLHKELVVCRAKMCGDVFTTAMVVIVTTTLVQLPQKSPSMVHVCHSFYTQLLQVNELTATL